MLNNANINRTFITNCINCLPFFHIAYPNENNGVRVVIIGITEEQEKQLDDGETITIETDRDSFKISPNLCYVYGAFNMNPNSEDINKMYKADWFRSLYINHKVFSEYDYNTHTITSDIEGGRWYETSNLKTYLPYLYGCIGKPKRIAIFKEYIALCSNKKKVKAKKKAATDAKYYINYKKFRQEQRKEKLEAQRRNKVSNLNFTIKKISYD